MKSFKFVTQGSKVELTDFQSSLAMFVSQVCLSSSLAKFVGQVLFGTVHPYSSSYSCPGQNLMVLKIKKMHFGLEFTNLRKNCFFLQPPPPPPHSNRLTLVGAMAGPNRKTVQFVASTTKKPFRTTSRRFLTLFQSDILLSLQSHKLACQLVVPL